MTNREEWHQRAARWLCISLGLLAAFLILRYGRAVLLSLILSVGVASVVYPLSVRTARVLHLPQRLCAVAYVFLLLFAIGGVVGVILVRIGRELEEVLIGFESEKGAADALERAWQAVLSWLSRVPLLGKALQTLRKPDADHAFGEMTSEVLRKALLQIGQSCSAAVGRMLRATPGALLFLIVTVMGTFYLSADYGLLCEGFSNLLSPASKARFEQLRCGAGRAARRYLRAYLLLFALTFCELAIGLWILKQRYVLLLALGIAAVDLLPVFGSGTVLIPWALIALLLGNHSLGLGLLILYGVITIVRQLAEPHLVGTSLGLHPFVTLGFMFVGWELFGVFGMLIAPAAAMLAKELLQKPREERHTDFS